MASAISGLEAYLSRVCVRSGRYSKEVCDEEHLGVITSMGQIFIDVIIWIQTPPFEE